MHHRPVIGAIVLVIGQELGLLEEHQCPALPIGGSQGQGTGGTKGRRQLLFRAHRPGGDGFGLEKLFHKPLGGIFLTVLIHGRHLLLFVHMFAYIIL